MSTDKYMAREYDADRYNCLHFTRDVWKDLTGQDIGTKLDGLMGTRLSRRVRKAHVRAFTRLDAPQGLCLVLMQRPKSQPHVGIHMRGKVLHIQQTGVEFLPVDIASRGFKTVRYYQ